MNRVRRLLRLFATLALVAVALTFWEFAVRAERGRGASDPAISSAGEPGTAVRASLPAVFLWAWERPEDLRFLNPSPDPKLGIGVAFLSETIEIRSPDSANPDSGVAIIPRRQPLRIQSGTPLMAVVRIETPRDLWHSPRRTDSNTALAPDYAADQRERIVASIVSAASLPGVTALQIDYDASRSEREFYAALLQDVRREIPREMPLSITALASWCIGDPWLNELPPGTIDEAVPMLFRMGRDAAGVASYLKSGNEFGPAACRGSLGLSTDEAFSQAILSGTIHPPEPEGRPKRIYIFSNHAWTRDEASKIRSEVSP
jgi:Protein of unknown function (DUF3142)